MSIDNVEPITVGRKQLTLTVESGIAVGVQYHSDEGRINFGLKGHDGVLKPRWMATHDVFLRHGHRISLIWARYERVAFPYLIHHETRH